MQEEIEGNRNTWLMRLARRSNIPGHLVPLELWVLYNGEIRQSSEFYKDIVKRWVDEELDNVKESLT